LASGASRRGGINEAGAAALEFQQGWKARTQLAGGDQGYEMAAGEVNSTQGYTAWREAAEDFSMKCPLTIKTTIHS